jgi:hypothetical protein
MLFCKNFGDFTLFESLKLLLKRDAGKRGAL